MIGSTSEGERVSPYRAFQNLQGLDPGKLIIVAGALRDVQTLFESLSVSWTPSEVLLELETALVNNGMNPSTAQKAEKGPSAQVWALNTVWPSLEGWKQSIEEMSPPWN